MSEGAHVVIDKGLAVEVSMVLQEKLKPLINRDSASTIAGVLHLLATMAKDMNDGDVVEAARMIDAWAISTKKMIIRPSIFMNG